MKTALIIGISGQDGSYLADFLLKKGYEVYGTSRDAEIQSFSNLKKLKIYNKCHLLSLSLNDISNIIQCLKNSNPDEIYNLSGQSSVGLSFEHPYETYTSISNATLNILEAIRIQNKDCKFYNACSSECYGNIPEPLSADEDTNFKPRSPYAVAKSSAFWTTALYREGYGIFASSGILFNHESPLRPKRFVSQKIIDAAIQISKGNKQYIEMGDIDIERDWGWAPEYVEAMYLMLQQKTPNDYVICTGETLSLRELIKEVFNQLDLDYNDHIRYKDTYKRPSEIQRSSGDNSKAQRKLNWTPKIKTKEVITKLLDAKKK